MTIKCCHHYTNFQYCKKNGTTSGAVPFEKIFAPNFNIILQKDCCVINSILYSFQNVSAFVTIPS